MRCLIFSGHVPVLEEVVQVQPGLHSAVQPAVRFERSSLLRRPRQNLQNVAPFSKIGKVCLQILPSVAKVCLFSIWPVLGCIGTDFVLKVDVHVAAFVLRSTKKNS